MKQLYSIIISLLFAIPCLAYDFSAPDVNDTTIYYNFLGGDSVEVTYETSNYKSYSGNVVISGTVQNGDASYRVTRIGEQAFYNCLQLASVTLPEGVARIEQKAFYQCAKLTSVNIPSSLTYIGEYAFWDCYSLISLQIPNSVEKIERNAFAEVPNVYYSGSLSGAPWGARCLNGYIDDFLVYEDETKTTLCACSRIAVGEIVLPSSVVNISKKAFSHCIDLTSITIPGSITTIEVGTFYACKSLSSVTLPNSVTSIGANAFEGCTNLQDFALPENLVSIGESAFASCNSLHTLTIPSSVTSVDSYAFALGILERVNMPDLEIWCKIKFGGPYANPLQSANHLYINDSEVKDLVLPDGIDTIGDYAFIECRSLKSATIPTTVEHIGANAFAYCYAMDSVYCSASTPPTLGDKSFSPFSQKSILFVPDESVESYKAIGDYTDAFSEIKGLSDVVNITETTADIIWLPDPEVTQYTITVYKDAVPFAQYIVDGDGQVVSSQRFAPSIYRHKQDTTQSSTEYFTVSVDELEAGTEYTYTIEGTNSQQQQVYSREGTFQTSSTEEIFDPIIDDPKSIRKIIRNGKIYILRGDQVYDLHGQLVDQR